jgi:hypothetical protein
MLIHQPYYVLGSGYEQIMYSDSAGQIEDEVMVYAGFASSEAKWTEFADRWTALMHEYDIKKPFHANQYAFAPYAAEDYRQFRNKEGIPARQRFEKKAIDIIKSTTRKPVAFSVNPKQMASVVVRYEVNEGFKTPLGLCGLRIVLEALEWMRRHPRGPKRVAAIKFVFEDGDQGQAAFSDALYAVTDERPLFEQKVNVPQFIPADILAWRHARLLKNDLVLQPGHEYWAGLFSQIPQHSFQALDTTNLERVFERLGFKKKGAA